jgi:hypothetical protein
MRKKPTKAERAHSDRARIDKAVEEIHKGVIPSMLWEEEGASS